MMQSAPHHHLRGRTVAILAGMPILLLLAAFGCRKGSSTNSTTAANENDNQVIVANQAATNSAVNDSVNISTTTASATEQELRRLASSFAERYGSYSNQTDYDNLESLLVFMTTSFATTTKTYVAAERAKHRDTSIYYGISTRATAVKTQSLEEPRGEAAFLVSTFRKETIGAAGNVTSFQEDALINFEREAGVWRVDRVIWQGRR